MMARMIVSLAVMMVPLLFAKRKAHSKTATKMAVMSEFLLGFPMAALTEST